VLERRERTSDLAFAYSNLSQLSMLSQDYEQAIRWGEPALEIATRLGDDYVRATRHDQSRQRRHPARAGKHGAAA
jgi:hypothetical protein